MEPETMSRSSSQKSSENNWGHHSSSGAPQPFWIDHRAYIFAMPQKMKGSDIYFETNENAKSLSVRCEKVL